MIKQGGQIHQVFDASFLRGFSASLPEEFATHVQKATEGGKHSFMYVPFWFIQSDYIETDRSAHTNS